MNEHERINYLEFPSRDLAATKHFFTCVFNWSFTDYGAEYTAFSSEAAGLDGGFYQAELTASSDSGGALVVFYSKHLEDTLTSIKNCGGSIIKPIYPFPGGRRFHFADPTGNEFAVWSDRTEA